MVMRTEEAELVGHLWQWNERMLGNTELTINGKTSELPNTGFWNEGGEESITMDSMPPLRILVCGYSGVGKSNLISKVFGVDLVSHVVAVVQGNLH